MSIFNERQKMRDAIARYGALDCGSNGIKADVIAESTSGAGVTIDGLLVKDGKIGATTAEIGNVYMGDSDGMYFGDDQDASMVHDGTKSINLSIADNVAAALDIKQGSNSYMTFVTTDSGEKITVSKGISTNQAITMTGTTGVNELVVTNNANDALSIKASGAADLIAFNTTATPSITITPATTVTGVLTSSAGISIAEAKNIAVGATNGTIIATNNTQKLGFYGKEPVVQPAGIANTNSNTDTLATTVNAVIAALESLGLLATV